MKLSICMMVKDEEKNLPRCLENLKPLIESGLAELIIIDTGSIDKSISIAKEYTNNVYSHKWNKNFSEMRNISISYARGEWIFIIDADERLDDTGKLITLMNSSKINKYNTIILKVKNLYTVNKESNYNLIASPRIFKNDGKFKYEGAVHNQAIFKGPSINGDIYITHFGYIVNDKELMESKYKRTTELLKIELVKNPRNLYYIYQLGISYDMHSDHKDSLNELRKAYRILSTKSLEEKKMYTYIYASYVRIAYTNGKFAETVKIAKEAINLKKDYVDLYYFLAIAEKQLGNSEYSFEDFNKYINLVNQYNELEISRDMSAVMYTIDDKSKSAAYFNICQYYINSEKYKDAYDIYNNITSINEKIYISVNLLIPLEKYSELRKVYNGLALTKDKNSFLSTLEDNIKKLEDSQKVKLYNEFSFNEDIYGLFNKLRISNNTDKRLNLIRLISSEIDFNDAPLFYSEIFVNMKDNIYSIIDIFKNLELSNIKNIVKYLVEEKDFKETFEKYILENNKSVKDIEEAKVFTGISNILLLLYINVNDEVSKKYLDMFKAYTNIGIFFVQGVYSINNAETIYKSVSNQEDRFFIIMYVINNLIKENNKKSAVKYLIKAVDTYKAFAKYIDKYKDEVLSLEEKKIAITKNKEFEYYKDKIKENISNLVNDGSLDEAKSLISEYEEIVKNDLEIYSIKAVIAIMENKFQESELILKEGLSIDKNNFDLNYNLAYLYEQEEKFNDAISYYKCAEDNCIDEVMKANINCLIKKIIESPNYHNINKEKLAIICLKGLDSFIYDIADELSTYYDVKKFIIENEKQIYEAIDWADIIWLEWANDSSIIATQYAGIVNKKVIIRIHGYEVFTNMPTRINWNVVDRLIFVAEHKRNLFFENFGKVIDFKKTEIIRNGINSNKYYISKNKIKNKNIAFVGNINYRKGLELLIQFFYELVQIDPEYKLYIRGQYQDLRLKIYDEQIINELGINENIIFVERVDDLNKWYANMTYIVSSSIEESFHYTIGEGMLAGLKPLVHAWKESRDLWPNKYIYRNRKDFLDIILGDEYEPEKYRKFVVDKYALGNQIKIIKELISGIRKDLRKNQKQLSLDFMKNSFNDFIPYTKYDLDKYDFKSYRILIGKKEKISKRYELYECIIENSLGKKLILTNIWYDNENNTIILPDCYKVTINSTFINEIVNKINSIEVNNNNGFILDDKLKKDVEENYLAYSWERGIQGTQFMPSIRYLIIIERYKFIGKFINKKHKVLEAAPGFGYGAAYLSTLCNEIDALDIAKENIEFGKSAYNFNNLNWVEGDVTKLPYDKNTFDVYISCETMEHLPLNIINSYLKEAVRVIKENGKMIITTPNRLTRQNVHNPYHIKEYTFSELKDILGSYFKTIDFYSVVGYKVIAGDYSDADGLMAVCYKNQK